MKPSEYQVGLHSDSWKLDLLHVINEGLEYTDGRESFIENMEQKGYEVTWINIRKQIAFACPNVRKCQDSSLHNDTFLKENIKTLFACRQAVRFYPGRVEPDEGWMGELASGLIQLNKSMEYSDNLPPFFRTDSK